MNTRTANRYSPVALIYAVSTILCASPCLGQIEGLPGGPDTSFQAGVLNTATVKLLLRNPGVRRELELTEEQGRQLDDVMQREKEAVSGIVRVPLNRKKKGETLQETEKQAREAFIEVQRRAERMIAEILLPHQLTRLRQLALQRRLGMSLQMFKDPELGKAIGLTPEQQSAVSSRVDEAQSELAKQIELLQEQARGKVLSLLTPEQRERYAELTGQRFSFGR
jgi:hypothetical protein